MSTYILLTCFLTYHIYPTNQPQNIAPQGQFKRNPSSLIKTLLFIIHEHLADVHLRLRLIIYSPPTKQSRHEQMTANHYYSSSMVTFWPTMSAAPSQQMAISTKLHLNLWRSHAQPNT